MTVYFWKKFKKDLQRLNDEGLKEQVAKLIEEIERAPDLRHLHNLKKMKGHPMAYRFRLGNYCLGVFIEGQKVIIARLLTRKEIYRNFP